MAISNTNTAQVIDTILFIIHAVMNKVRKMECCMGKFSLTVCFLIHSVIIYSSDSV